MHRWMTLSVAALLCLGAGCISPNLGVSASRSRMLTPSHSDFATHGSCVIKGAATKPGTYTIKGRMTLTQAVAAAGGVTAESNAGVEIIHATSSLKSTRHNLKKIAVGKAKDPTIKDGDMILLMRAD